jgi:hypothetical protein
MPPRFTTWRDVLRDFVRLCEQSTYEEQEARIHEAQELSNFAGNVAPQQGAPQIQAMLAAGAFESAALTLLPFGTAFIISRGREETFATVTLPDRDVGVTARGNTVALAILRAHALALICQDEASGSID